MDDLDYDAKLVELDRLLNDPESNLEPARVWMLLDEISRLTAHQAATPAGVY